MTQPMPVAAPASARTTLAGRLVARSALTERDVTGMFELLSSHFDGVDRDTFDRDLDDKNWVVILSDEEGAIRGFSTFLLYETSAAGRPLTMVYSGDTIVEPSAWGTHALPRAWIRAVYDLRRRYPAGELYWLLLTSGFRTYRFMSVFCRSFYPRFDQATPIETQAMIDALSAERFGAAYLQPAGLVRFARPQVLRGDLREVPEGRMDDPHVRYFLDRNPGHAAGDELVSLASLAFEDLTPAGQRMTR